MPKKGLSWLSSSREETSPDTFVSYNPSHIKEELGIFGCASKKQIESALTQAQAAFQRWKKVPAPVRAGLIANFGKLLEANKEKLSQIMTQEIGKPIKEARGDVQEAIDTCQFFVSEGRRLYGMTVPSEMPQKELTTYRRPLGVFACITAGNFPVAVPSWYFIPALVTGNTCVWKPSEDAPCTSYAFAQLLFKAGCPEDVFQVLFGQGGGSTGEALVEAVNTGKIQKFGFTGSSLVGQKIGEICGRNLVNPCLELGGKNPMVIMEDADLDLAVEGALWAGFGTAGQRCTSLGNLILHESLHDRFLKKLLPKVKVAKIGDPKREDILYGPMISKKFFESHLKHLEDWIKPHHQVLTNPNGAMRDKPYNEGLFCFPTIVDGVTPKDAIYAQETFGPLFNVMTCKDLGEGLRLANGTGYGLSSALYTKNPEYVYLWKEEIGAGMTSINNSTTGAEAHLPFGGNGRSGNGSRQSGVWVLDQFTRWQAVNWDMSGRLQRAQMETAMIVGDTSFRL